MGQLLRYSGITTKIRAMEGRLLRQTDYQMLAEMPDVRSAVEYLAKQPAYAVLFASDENTSGPADMHRGEIEKLITRSLFQDFQKIYGFCGLEQRNFLKLYYRRFEVDLIKYLFRLIFNHDNQPYYISTRRAFFEKYSHLDLNRLIASDTLEELIENLKDTEYYGPLSRVKASGRCTLFDYEVTLDLYHFSMFWRAKNKLLSGKELANVTRNYGMKIDMLNIQWAYRAKKYYNLPSTQVYAMAIPTHYKLKKQEFMKLAESEDMNEFFGYLKASYYGKRYESVVNGEFEQMYRQVLDKLYQGDMRKNPYSIAAVNTYLYKKEQEIDFLTSVLECIRYGLEPHETLKYIRN